jgi:hypothetical protein
MESISKSLHRERSRVGDVDAIHPGYGFRRESAFRGVWKAAI